MATQTQIADLLIRLAKSLVEDDEGFESRAMTPPGRVIVTVRPGTGRDMARLIGREGSVVQAFQSIGFVFGKLNGCAVTFNVTEPLDNFRKAESFGDTSPQSFAILLQSVLSFIVREPGLILNDSLGILNLVFQVDKADEDKWNAVLPSFEKISAAFGFLAKKRFILCATFR